MNDGLLALLGTTVGAAASVITAWFAARHERRTRRDDADHAVRAALAEKQEDRELAEHRAFHDYLAARRLLIITALDQLQHGRPDTAERLLWVPPPAFVFTPPAIAKDLVAGSEELRAIFVAVLCAVEEERTTEKFMAFVLKVKDVQAKNTAKMGEWAERLREGVALREHHEKNGKQPPVGA